ncbi:hypothetical protein [Falsiphaeobacter marinintestinus]|nr:hypothetical protein [Phaeobacter marinintestinus]
MTRIVAAVLTFLALAACGVDGEPIPPTQNATTWLSPVAIEVSPLAE